MTLRLSRSYLPLTAGSFYGLDDRPNENLLEQRLRLRDRADSQTDAWTSSVPSFSVYATTRDVFGEVSLRRLQREDFFGKDRRIGGRSVVLVAGSGRVFDASVVD